MPTGYTAAIKDGISSRQFILQCARSRGACIMQRDEPFDELPKKREPSNYHVEKILEAKRILAEIDKMTYETASAKAEEEYQREVKSLEERIEENEELRRKYENMLSEVRKWNPPTQDHTDLKEFMLSQIRESIKFDCRDSYYLDRIKKLRCLTGQEWKDEKVKQALSDLNYHRQKHNEELERCRQQNEWVDALYSSLPDEDGTSCA